MMQKFGVYRPTRTISKTGGTATFFGLIFSSYDVIDVLKAEFDYQEDSSSEEPLVIVESEELTPYVLSVSVTLGGEKREGWQSRAWAIFGRVPIVDSGGQELTENGFKKIFLPPASV